MNTIHLSALTGPDGTVTITVPTDAGAGQRVEVEVNISKYSSADYSAWATSVVGSIRDPHFVRPPQPPIEQIDPL